MSGSFHIEITFLSSLEKELRAPKDRINFHRNDFYEQISKRKIYNRCCLGHILLSATIHRLLHLEQFLEYNDIHENFINDELESWKNSGPESVRFKHLFQKICYLYGRDNG